MNINEIDQFLKSRDLPSIVGLAVNQNDIVYEGAFGVTNTTTSDPINIDTPHAIMSMTKPITSVATMMLIESGELALDSVAKDYLPQYADMKVIANANLANKTYDTIALERDFTIRDLLTNTAGLSYDFCNETLFTFDEHGDSPDFPLLFQPGQGWAYSLATKLLGEIVEKIKGKPIGEAYADMIFAPLGMNETSFIPRTNQVSPHVPGDNGWQPIDLWEEAARGDGGLISTARDYAKFLQCLLNDCTPLLKSETFKSMVSNQIGDLVVEEQPAANTQLTYPFPLGAGVDKFGYGFQLSTTRADSHRNVGSYSWCGLLNTYFWGDPVQKVGGILLMQTLPFYSPICIEALQGFEGRLYQSVF